jgi:hypothetical protein
MVDMEDIGGMSIANAENGTYIDRETGGWQNDISALPNIMHSNPQGHDHVSTQNLMINKVKPWSLYCSGDLGPSQTCDPLHVCMA